jgi:DNA (cytosine-5)-methyltransferase 1
MSHKSVWDKSIPVELSPYINKSNIEFFNTKQPLNENDGLTMIDLFCGAGGFSVGCSWSGFVPIIGVDHFIPAMDTWLANHKYSIGCLGDIRDLDPHILKQLLREKGIEERVNLITGGVPCQGFSRANRKQNDNDERNFLFLEYMRFVKEFLPDYIILENVSGMKSAAGGKFVKDIQSSMEVLGYEVSTSMLNAADYGVPQNRHRLFFVGVRKDSGLKTPYEFPKPIFGNEKKYRTVFDAISDLPELNVNEEKEVYENGCLCEYQKLMRGEGSLPVQKSDKLYNHKAPNHPKNTIERIDRTAPGSPMYTRFKQRIRLSFEDPSPTQLAGGIRPQFQFGHPSQARGLSIRERARIQSFPDSYVFKGGIVQERVQTGNAVPPLLVYELVKEIYNDIIRRDKG